MGIKGLPEQLKHYYRDAQVEQFKGAPRFSFQVVVVVCELYCVCFKNFNSMSLLSFSLRCFEKISIQTECTRDCSRARSRDVHHR
jgi:predicted ester cyclase